MEPGEQIGDYIIVRQIGEGGMSVVYLAEHKETGAPAVVKRLRQQLALEEQLVRYFVQGARIMHELRHPHLAAVYDYIEHGDRYFMVEEYLSGGSLADLLDKGEPISEKQALIWCRDALRAVDYAHQSGIVHRDLKPGNLMLNQERQVKVTDFGIARVFGGPRLTKTGDEKGTPLYMSPEQIRTPDKVDHSTDVYSMGVVLYELLTRHVPFEGESEFDIKQAVVREPPPPPRQLNRSISRDAERIVLKALQKRPENRFTGCGDFALHIDRCLSSGKGPVWNPLEWIKEHRRIAAGLLVVLLAAIPWPGIGSLIDLLGQLIGGGGVERPTIEFAANPREITSGQKATLEWTTQNADKVRIEPDIGEVPAKGSRTVTPTKSVSYLLTATGRGGTESKSTLMTVRPEPIPMIEITASHAVITPGHPTVLRWKVRHADTVSIEPGIGEVPPDGSRIVAPQKSVKYTVTARGPGGIATQSVDLIVNVTPKSAGVVPTIVLAANPPMITSGQATVLQWETQNAESVRIEPDVGPVPLSGTRKVNPPKSVEYTATATGPAGTQTAKVRIAVEPPPPAAPTLTLTAKPEVIQAGQEAVLEWEGQNAFNVRIEPDLGLGVLPLTGRVKVKPTKSVTYSATATGPGGTRASATAHITVESPAPQVPTIKLQAKPEVIEAGQRTLIEWEARHASSVRIEPEIGDVAATGSLPVTVTKSVSLVATATGPGGKASATIDIKVEPRRPSLKGTGGTSSEKRPGTGTIVWTGKVDRDEQIVIEGASANIGIVQGSLPGVPCRIQISDDGAVAVVEGPGPGNGFKRVVLRSKKRGSFSVKINWEVLN
jgi:tRNA A-37 threonylcarbamoyl transferase component Bud32